MPTIIPILPACLVKPPADSVGDLSWTRTAGFNEAAHLIDGGTDPPGGFASRHSQISLLLGRGVLQHLQTSGAISADNACHAENVGLVED